MDEYVKRQLSSVPGHIGFYYKNLVTGETDGSRQTELFQAASVIKLPILAAILLEEREHPGVLQERLLVRDGDKVPGCGALQHISGTQAYDIESLCKLMITISDNTATNVLIRRFGIEFLPVITLVYSAGSLSGLPAQRPVHQFHWIPIPEHRVLSHIESPHHS